jgi:hypothetical protein
MAETNQPRTAKDLAQELMPALETLANIRYLIDRDPELFELRRLLRTEGQVLETLTQRVMNELDG